jgi:N-methylhydantoinase A
MGIRNAITLDIGGTTAKAAMIEEGRIAHSPEYEVGASLSAGNRLVGGGGELIRAPTIDIAEVGAGGGSLAFLDRAGGLHVGPRSAGAVPGPACYRRGGSEPTVTDANVILGYIRTGQLADGSITIDLDAAQRAIHDHIAKPLGMNVLRAAEGIHRIANARTMRALRAVSTERGRDPRDFVLMAFGGSGPIHAAGLARELYIQRVIVPPLPGLFSALGLLSAGIVHTDARSCLLSGEGLTVESLQLLANEMREQMLAQFQHEGFVAEQVQWTYHADVRFKGQASEIRILLESVVGANAAELREPMFTEHTLLALRLAFESEHKRLYGHGSAPDNPLEVVALRLVGRVPMELANARLNIVSHVDDSNATMRRAYFGERYGVVETPVVMRHAIMGVMRGPLLIDEYDSTTVVPPDFQVQLDEWSNLVLSVES